MTLERVRDEFCKAVRREMASVTYSVLPTGLIYFEYEYGIKANMLGRILNRSARWKKKGTLKEILPEFDIEYKPGWDFNLVIRRKSTPKL